MNEGEWTNALVTVWVTSCVWVGSHFIMTRTHFSVKETETQRGEDPAQDIQQRSLGLLFLKCVCPSTPLWLEHQPLYLLAFPCFFKN